MISVLDKPVKQK